MVETVLIEVASTVVETGVFPEENPLKGQEGLEAKTGNAEVEPLEAFDNDPSVQTREALVASEQLVDRRKPNACPRNGQSIHRYCFGI